MQKERQARRSAAARAIASLSFALYLPCALAQNIAFDIPAQPLETALKALADQSGLQLAFSPVTAGPVSTVKRPTLGHSMVTRAPYWSIDGVQSSLPPSPGQAQGSTPGHTRIIGSPAAIPIPHSLPHPMVTRSPGLHGYAPARRQPHSRLSPATMPLHTSVGLVCSAGITTGTVTELLS